MTKAISKLSNELIKEFKSAEEIWVAVALINSTGLNLILDNLKKGCKQNYLVGIDLPTDPKALKKLFDLQFKADLQVRLYSKRGEYFHPKVYLFSKSDLLMGFIGSANCTNGGLNSNVELSILVDDQDTCGDIQTWFNKLFDLGMPLTKKFLSKYSADYAERLRKKKEDEVLVQEEKNELNLEVEATFSERKKLIKVLKSYRNREEEYKNVQKVRKKSIKDLRDSLDYPNFNDIDIDKFFSIWELGHILAIPKPTILREKIKFKKLLLMLCNEELEISVRYNLALKGDLKIRGINEGFISKILAIHKPDLYFVKNGRTETALSKYGIVTPRGLSSGDKYKIINRELKQICIETDIVNLSVLDNYLYREGKPSDS